MKHQHIYDASGKQLCCTEEEKIYAQAGALDLIQGAPAKEVHHHEDGHDHSHEGPEGDDPAFWKPYLPATISMVLLLLGIAFDQWLQAGWFVGYLRLAWYLGAYLPVGLPVFKEAWQSLRKGQFFTEFTLMGVATLGAFALGEYPEGVAVMLFYAIGELFQGAAVRRAKSNIKALLDVRPASALVLRDGQYLEVPPEKVNIGETIEVRVGEKVPLDGTLLSEGSSFNTAALTGESKPQSYRQGEQVLAGMLNLEKVIQIQVSKVFADSSLARILDMVQNATARKARTELLIRRFARIYTPIVFFLALALVLVPYFVVAEYSFSQWLYRALVFLVISCPCALVISIPLGYFGGIGAASRHGILFKGSNYLDLITRLNTLVLDKTGTLTKGIFQVQKIVPVNLDEAEFLRLLVALEKKSTHPIAKAIVSHSPDTPYEAEGIEEISGKGLRGRVNGKEVLAGNTALLRSSGIGYDPAIDSIVESIVVMAAEGQYAGYVLVADELKDDAAETIRALHSEGISQVYMLSGDKDSITQQVAAGLGIDRAYGGLLPEQKVEHVEALKKEAGRVIAFVGDGINDAPVLALSDIGIAMGGLGSDAAIETADVVIQNDQPSRIVTAMRIGRATRRVVIQNISLAFLVKIAVLVLGAGGLATMWEAVFADVGVALLAILNAVRILRMRFL